MSLYFRSLDGLIEEHLMNVYLGLKNIYPQLIKIIAYCEDMMKGDGGGWNGLIEKTLGACFSCWVEKHFFMADHIKL